MKKILLILLTSVLLLSNSALLISADEESSFVPSIGYKSDIYVPDDEYGTVDNTDEHSVIHREDDGHCELDIVITPYAKKETIESDQSKKEIDIAYEQVLNTTSVCSLAPVVSDYIAVSRSGLPDDLEDDDLVFSNIFDITTYVREYGLHDASYDHGKIYRVKVGAESLKNFVCLLHYDYDTNTWELVEDCVIVDDEYLLFSYPNASPFVIVAYVGDGVVKGKRSTGSGSSDYKAVNTQTGEGLVASHHCLFQIGGTCYCYVVGALAVLSVFVNIYLIIRNKELKKYSRN